jgi:hypothetical protein
MRIRFRFAVASGRNDCSDALTLSGTRGYCPLALKRGDTLVERYWRLEAAAALKQRPELMR